MIFTIFPCGCGSFGIGYGGRVRQGRSGGSFTLLKDRHGFVMAGMEDVKYREYELELLLEVRADIDRFVGEAEQFDDITMLALQVRSRV